MADTSSDAVLTLDAEFRVTGANEEAERLFGYAREELLGRAVESLFPEEDPEALDARWNAALGDDPAGSVFRLDGRRKDGRTVTVEVKVKSLAGGSGFQAWIKSA